MNRQPSKLLSRAVDILLLVAAGGVSLAIIPVLVPASGQWWREYSLTRRISPIQSALENHRQRHGAYPESLEAAAIPDPGEIHYQRDPDGAYTLWFGMGLGESVTFRPGR